MKIPRRPLKKARIEIIPMIDTMFFLLVFFMMATLTMTNQFNLPVNLPHAVGSQDKTQQVITLTLSKDGKLFYNREQIAAPAEAAARLTLLAKEGRQSSVIINADRSVEHGRVVELLDAIRQSGSQKISVAVSPAS
ncbi:MAG TPA: biopolymer transporter ExbD [Patescibacteria group bacterium]|nr:biopolymer transporter ExbD [Patescibacteria group bacterium]